MFNFPVHSVKLRNSLKINRMKTLLVLLLQTWGAGRLAWNAKQFMCVFGASQQACKSRGQGFVEEGLCGGKEAKKRSKKGTRRPRGRKKEAGR